ncbi:hypothetical protein [Arachidicoccus terrestris]|uniref:hypothetical protein n=1 Tax=Arachidicoccus terrestris TaxID=2875539 RepID=UPI001CC4C5D5|nr:hypothetical protein [Arachidicoccus terrestris]UAY56228.1 hypothetical protein K9M52_04210 [Arachidicoccus terrestris]
MIKTKYDSVRALIIKNLSEETSLSPSFVRQAIRGDRDSESAEKIKKEYKKRYATVTAALGNPTSVKSR